MGASYYSIESGSWGGMPDASMAEGGWQWVNISRTGDTSTSHTLLVTSSDGSASAGSDYTSISQTVEFSAGETSERFIFGSIEDSTVESNETVNLTLSAPSENQSEAIITTNSATMTILNDDDDGPSYWNIALSNNSVKEGQNNSISIELSRTGSLAAQHGFDLKITGGSASNGSDYVSLSTTGEFGVGESSETISWGNFIIDDNDIESDETIRITLEYRPNNPSTASNGNVMYGVTRTPQFINSTATLTIKDNDAEEPTYSLSTSASSLNEGATLTSTVSTENVSQGTTLYWSASGPGINSSDFSSGGLTGSETVAGNGTFTFSHTLSNDLKTEGSETLEVKLFSNSARTTQVGSTVSVTINDTSIDPVSYYSIGDVQGYEGDNLFALISRTGSFNAQTLNVSYANGSAFAGFDYTAPVSSVTFASGESSKLFAISTIEDSLVEGDETLSLTLSSTDANAKFTDASATLTILNDDSATSTNITQNYTYNTDNSTTYKITIGGDVNVGNTSTTSNNVTTNNVVVDYKFTGTAGADSLQGYSGDNFGDDLLDGGAGNDDLRGYRGSDFLTGGAGDDDVRGGNGRDTLTGGQGSDSLFGGFGINTFEDEDDGYADSLYLKSDQLAYNWIYEKAGNSPNGQKADEIGELDSIDKVYIQGASTEQLSFGYANHTTPLGDSFSGIGIYAAGTLEAVYTGANHSLAQLKSMVFGADA